MKKLHLPFLLALAMMFFASCSRNSYSIMSYNVRNCKGLDNVTNIPRIAEIITRHTPDFVALQELDSMTTRYNQKYVLEEIANAVAMNYIYAPAINYDGGKYGIGLLSKEKAISAIQIPLPGTEESRTLLLVEFEKLYVCCTHFSLTPADQLESVKVLRDFFAHIEKKTYSKKPIILAGDINATPDSETQKMMLKYFKNLSGTQPTFPANAPDRCIDYIYYFNPIQNNAVSSKNKQVIEESVASDHRPVMIQIKF